MTASTPIVSCVAEGYGHASFDEAAVAILRILDDGEWHKSIDEVHKPLRPWVAESMFGRVKSYFKIEHRKVGGGPASYFEWRSWDVNRDRRVRSFIEEGFPSGVARTMAGRATNGAGVERMLEQLRSRLPGVSDAKLIEGLVADGVPRRLAKAMLAETRGEGTEPGRPLPRPRRSH